MAGLFISPFTPAIGLNGLVAPAATLTFYTTGTSTAQNVYADAGLVTSLGNVVTANAQGQFVPIYLASAPLYRAVLKTSLGAVLGDIDPITQSSSAGGGTVLASVAALQALPVSYIYASLVGAAIADGPFTYATVGAPYTIDGINVIQANGISPSVGAWIRQPLSSLNGGQAFNVTTNSVDTKYGGVVMTSVMQDGLLVGAVPGSGTHAKFVVQTARTDDLNGCDIYFYSDQAIVDNQRSPLSIHCYADAVALGVDIVGAKTACILRQANNSVSRADKPATYVGTGMFTEWQRARPAGGGVFPTGNIGGNLDRLTFGNTYGNLCFYGTDAQDWDGTNTKAPIQIGTYANFLNRMLYMGYRNDLNKSVIGSIDTVAAAFTYLDIAALAMRPIGDNVVSFGADTLNWSTGYFYTVKTQAQTVAALPNSVTAGAGTRAFVSDSSVAASANFGAIVAGGGANKVPVFSDGANWRIG